MHKIAYRVMFCEQIQLFNDDYNADGRTEPNAEYAAYWTCNLFHSHSAMIWTETYKFLVLQIAALHVTAKARERILKAGESKLKPFRD